MILYDSLKVKFDFEFELYYSTLFTGIIALVSYAVGILFVFGNGYYFVDVFDMFGATFPLLLIALFECLAVIFYSAKLKEKTTKELFTAGIEKCAVHVLTSIACLRTRELLILASADKIAMLDIILFCYCTTHVHLSN